MKGISSLLSLRRTHRRRLQFNRKRRQVNIRKSMSTYTPIRYFSPWPQNYRVTCNYQLFDFMAVDTSSGLSSAVYDVQSLGLPWVTTTSYSPTPGITTTFAGGFLPMLFLYTRAIVKKARVRTRFQSAMTDTSAGSGVLVSAIVQTSNAQQVFATNGNPSASQIYNLGTLPQAKVHMIGQADGGLPAVMDYQSVDNQKFEGQGLDMDYAIIRDSAQDSSGTPNVMGVTIPSTLLIARMPCYFVAYGNTNPPNATSRIGVYWDVDFDIEFSGLLPMSVITSDVNSGSTYARQIIFTQRAQS